MLNVFTKFYKIAKKQHEINLIHSVNH